MRVLKFGGTSVGSVQNIKKVISIVAQGAKTDRLIVVVSAIGGITNKLIKAGNLAAAKDSSYITLYEEVKDTHNAFAKALTASNRQTLDTVGVLMKDLEALLQGIFLINELSPKTLDKLAAFGERSSSIIIAAAFNEEGVVASHKDSRKLITTDIQFTKAAVHFEATNKKIKEHFGQDQSQITIL